MFILHGENTVQSRNALFQQIQEVKSHQTEIVRIETKSLTAPQLTEILGASSLFETDRVFVIEELHSLPKSKRKDELIHLLGDVAKNQSAEVILWEKRALTTTMLKQFPGAKNQEFKVTNALFSWLDSLTGNANAGQKKVMIEKLRLAIENDGEVMCFTFLARQIRLLIQILEGETAGLAPFIVGKMKKQATTFSVEKLLQLHHRLTLMDLDQKTSHSSLGLARDLELLLVEL